MTTEAELTALVARLDERSLNMLERLDDLKTEIAATKAETLQGRTETAKVQQEMAGLNTRERERNGFVKDLVASRNDHEDRLRQLQSQVNDQGLARDNELQEMSASVGQLLSWKHTEDEADELASQKAQETALAERFQEGRRDGRTGVLLTQRRLALWLFGAAASSGLLVGFKDVLFSLIRGLV